MLERLHKILARSGVAALRPAEDMILAGRVTVNGRTVRELGARADAEVDTIAVDGQAITVPTANDPHRYFILHKPVGVISTASDPEGRPTVTQLVPDDVRVFPVGRLDADSEGLLLLTDDGDLAYRLTHPRFGIEKEYRVLLDKAVSVEAIRQWRGGVMLPDGEQTAPAWVELLDRAEYGDWLRVVLQEGKKREIREVARLLGYDVRRLLRVREGPLLLDNLPVGTWRALSADEVETLRRYTQHVPSREADEARESLMSDPERGPRRLRIVRKPQRPAQIANPSTPANLPDAISDQFQEQAVQEAQPPMQEAGTATPEPRPIAQAVRPARTRFDDRAAPRGDERGFQLPPPARGNERSEPGRMSNADRPGGRTFDRGPQRSDARPNDRPPNNGPQRSDRRPADRPYTNAPRSDARPNDRPYNPQRDNGFANRQRNDEARGGPGSYEQRPPPRRDDQPPRFPERGGPQRGFGSRSADGGGSFDNRQGDMGGPGRSEAPRGAQPPFGRRDDQQPRGFGGPSNGPRREGGYGQRRPEGPPDAQGQDRQPRFSNESAPSPGRGIRDFSNRSSFDRRGPAPRSGYGSRPPQRPDDRRNEGSSGRPGGYPARGTQRPADRRNDDRSRGFGERPSGPNRFEADRGNFERRDEHPGGFNERPSGPRSGSSSRFGGPSRGSSSNRFGGPARGGSGGSRFGGGTSRSGPSRGPSSGPRRRKNG
ncbi:MAG: pseudouridine synthase [Herpetosiphonaceae bacterium]|nr:pseudouridine synthase [Herpetosiphonaceae bacterium]